MSAMSVSMVDVEVSCCRAVVFVLGGVGGREDAGRERVASDTEIDRVS